MAKIVNSKEKIEKELKTTNKVLDDIRINKKNELLLL